MEKHRQIIYPSIFTAAVIFAVCFNIFAITARADNIIPASEFEDENFYQYVLRIADTNGDGQLTESEAEAVRNVDFDESTSETTIGKVTGITSIKGIEHLKNVTQVFLGDNEGITDGSPMAGLTKIEVLDMGTTGIADVSFAKDMRNMRIFRSSAYVTEITGLSVVAGFENLGEFLIFNSKVSDISFLSGLTKLYSVRIHGEEIEYPDITGIEALRASKDSMQFIQFDKAALEDLSLISEMTNLESLVLGVNIPPLKELPDMTGLSKLIQVEISGNSLTEDELYRKLPSQITSQDNWQQLVGADRQIFDEEQTGEEQTGEVTTGSDSRNSITSVVDNTITAAGHFEENVYLYAKQVDDVSEYEEMLEKITSGLQNVISGRVYDIALYKNVVNNGLQTQLKVQPDGTVEIMIEIENQSSVKYHVFRQEDDGSLTELNSFVKDGKLHFYSDHFSIFTVIMTKFFGEEDTDASSGEDKPVTTSHLMGENETDRETDTELRINKGSSEEQNSSEEKDSSGEGKDDSGEDKDGSGEDKDDSGEDKDGSGEDKDGSGEDKDGSGEKDGNGEKDNSGEKDSSADKHTTGDKNANGDKAEKDDGSGRNAGNGLAGAAAIGIAAVSIGIYEAVRRKRELEFSKNLERSSDNKEM